MATSGPRRRGSPATFSPTVMTRASPGSGSSGLTARSPRATGSDACCGPREFHSAVCGSTWTSPGFRATTWTDRRSCEGARQRDPSYGEAVQEVGYGSGTGTRSRTMIVDSAHYKDGVRQHEDALTPERAAELRDAAGNGEFVWV